MRITCREFKPLPGDPLSKIWLKGNKPVTLNLPPYAMPLAQKAKTSKDMDVMLNTKLDLLIEELRYGQENIVATPLEEAARHASTVSVLPQTCISFC